MITREQVEKRVAEFTAACRRQGIKVTHQRIEILRELAGTEDHPDAETVHKKVRGRMPSISLDTVYRTLRFFEEKAVIARVGSMRERTRFDANMDQHHHFVCTRCGLIRDFYSAAPDRLKTSAKAPELGCVDSVYVELRGVCTKCRKEKRTGR